MFNGRPAPEEIFGRQDREIRVYDLLDKLSIAYGRTDHEAAYTMEACEEIDRVLGVRMCKNLFLCNRQRTKHYLLLMPGDKKFLTKELSQQIGSARLSFAGEEDMLRYLDILPGAVSVMGLMNDHEGHVQLLMDEDLLNEAYMGCHPCVNTSSIKVSMEDIMNVFLPAVGHHPVKVKLLGE